MGPNGGADAAAKTPLDKTNGNNIKRNRKKGAKLLKECPEK